MCEGVHSFKRFLVGILGGISRPVGQHPAAQATPWTEDIRIAWDQGTGGFEGPPSDSDGKSRLRAMRQSHQRKASVFVDER